MCTIGLTSQNKEKKKQKVYCELIGEYKALSFNLNIRIEFGQEELFESKKVYKKMIEKVDKEFKYEKLVSAINQMSKLGWQFEYAYTVKEDNDIQHWLLSKEIEEETEIFEGFLSENDYNELRRTLE